MSLVVAYLLVLLFGNCTSFYLPPNARHNWHDAESYCLTKCSSDLLSIRDNIEYQAVLNYINTLQSNTNMNIWIGLNDIDEESKYEWIDGEPYHGISYNSNNTITAIPGHSWWVHDAPNLYNESTNCVVFSHNNNYLMKDIECDTHELPFLCNYCVDNKTYTDVTDAKSYYISTNRFHWPGAADFCISHCESNMVSIHSMKHFEISRTFARHNEQRVLFNKSNGNIFIGLHHFVNEHGYWNDNSPFNFGREANETPWALNEPHYIPNDDAVYMSVKHNYLWSSAHLGMHSFVMCDSCDSKIEKYIAFDINLTFSEAELFCNQYIGNNLASFHSANDYEQALKLQTYLASNTGHRHVWYGMYANYNEYKWTDNTKIDFLYNNISNNSMANSCIQYSQSAFDYGYKWHNVNCNQKAYFVCNGPSETNYFDVSWNILEGNWQLKDNHLILNNNTQLTDDAVVIISDKQWVNTNGNMSIELMFSIISMNGGSAGVVIFDGLQTCNYYYIGMQIIPSSRLFISRSLKNDNYSTVAWNKGPDHLEINEFYLLNIKIINRKFFKVYVDNVLYIEYLDDSLSINTDNDRTFSGYVGLTNSNLNIMVNSFHISGSPLLLNNDTKHSLDIKYIKNECAINIDIQYGLRVKIYISYTLVSIDDQLTITEIYEIIETAIQELIDKEQLKHCILSDDYDIQIIADTNNYLKSTIVATIFVCDVSTQNELIVDFSDNLQTDFVNIIEKRIDVEVDDIDILSNGFESTLSFKGTDTLDSNDSSSFMFILIIIIVAICFCVVIISLCLVYRIRQTNKYYHVKQKQLRNQIQPMINNYNQKNHIELSPKIANNKRLMHDDDIIQAVNTMNVSDIQTKIDENVTVGMDVGMDTFIVKSNSEDEEEDIVVEGLEAKKTNKGRDDDEDLVQMVNTMNVTNKGNDDELIQEINETANNDTFVVMDDIETKNNELQQDESFEVIDETETPNGNINTKGIIE